MTIVLRCVHVNPLSNLLASSCETLQVLLIFQPESLQSLNTHEQEYQCFVRNIKVLRSIKDIIFQY